MIPQPWRKLRELSKEYGDIFYLQMGDTPTIVLGSAQVAWDLLEKRSNIYSSRPRAVLGGEILSNNRRGLLTPYGDRWRRWCVFAFESKFVLNLAQAQGATHGALVLVRPCFTATWLQGMHRAS